MSEITSQAQRRHEGFQYPSAYRLMAHISKEGEVVVDMTMEELEKELTTAWDLQHRALARLILEIARLRETYD